MERMLVVVFDNEKKAYEGKSALNQLQYNGDVSIYAEAVVVKHADGTISPRRDRPLERSDADDHLSAVRLGRRPRQVGRSLPLQSLQIS